MVELAKKKKNRLDQVLKVWDWIAVVSLLVGLIAGSVLIGQWWDKRQRLTRLQVRLQELQTHQNQIQQQYQQQDINLVLVASLAEKPAIKAFFTNLLTTYALKFAQIKKIDISGLPLKFKGLYWDKKTGNGYGEMGYCSLKKTIHPTSQKRAKIALNRLYLLNKFGHNEYFTSNPELGNYSYLDISFDKMIDTCSHELAHYIQLVKHSKSSCESDLILENGKYSAELAQEHKEWTQEIYQLIRGEISQWERRWKEI